MTRAAPKDTQLLPATSAKTAGPAAGRFCHLLQAVRADGASLLGGLRALVSELPGEDRVAWAAHLQAVEELLGRLAAHPLLAALVAADRASTPAVRRQFAALVRLRREAAGLSRAKLSRRTRISEAALKLLESGRHCPSRTTLLRLLSAPELGLSWEDIGKVRPELGADWAGGAGNSGGLGSSGLAGTC